MTATRDTPGARFRGPKALALSRRAALSDMERAALGVRRLPNKARLKWNHRTRDRRAPAFRSSRGIGWQLQFERRLRARLRARKRAPKSERKCDRTSKGGARTTGA